MFKIMSQVYRRSISEKYTTYRLPCDSMTMGHNTRVSSGKQRFTFHSYQSLSLHVVEAEAITSTKRCIDPETKALIDQALQEDVSFMSTLNAIDILERWLQSQLNEMNSADSNQV